MEAKNKPLISIITCTLNSEQFLKQCLDSLSIQTYKDFEHLIVDGGSTDSTLEIINKYRSKQTGVRLLTRKAKGISDAMNTGMKHAKGKYMYYLHSDDSLYAANTLALAAKLLSKKHPDMLVGKILQITKNNDQAGTFPSPVWFSLPKIALKFVNFIPHQAVFLKKEILQEHLGFDTTLKYCMDYDLWLKIYFNAKTLFVNRIISKYRIHEGSLSSNSSNKTKVESEGVLVQKKYIPQAFWFIIYVSNMITKFYVYAKKIIL